MYNVINSNIQNISLRDQAKLADTVNILGTIIDHLWAFKGVYK